MKAKAIVVIWVVLISVIITTLSLFKISTFDHDQRLIAATSDLYLDKYVSEAITESTNNKNLSYKVYIMLSDSCFCEQMAEKHISEIEEYSAKENFEFSTIKINSSSNLARYIPSTPAVVIFDKNEKLSYLGPLSSGAFCTTSNNFLFNFIKNGFENKLPGASILFDSEGCYCNLI